MLAVHPYVTIIYKGLIDRQAHTCNIKIDKAAFYMVEYSYQRKSEIGRRLIVFTYYRSWSNQTNQDDVIGSSLK